MDFSNIVPWIIEHKWWVAPLVPVVLAIIVVKVLNN